MRVILRRLCAATVVALLASSLAGGEFAHAVPGWNFEFPRDHGAHGQFRTEWWYYTGHLTSESGREYGFEVTFFRVGVSRAASDSPWAFRDVGLAHFAITDVGGKAFRYYEKLNRMTPYLASAREGFLHVRNEGWSATTAPDGSFRLRASAEGDAIDLMLRSRKAPAIHGENGVSVKAEGVGYASHYYSLTRLEVTGTVRAGGRTERCRGLAWMDHEFGGAVLREHQTGWDWFSIQLDNETELMLYVIRRRDGTPDTTSSGSLVLEDGRVIHLRREQFRIRPTGSWRSRKSGAKYPMGWRIEVPDLRLTLRLRERLREQELVTARSTQVTYWEGAVLVDGSFGQTPVRGKGYVEMTGYDRAFTEGPLK
ncbi:MAG: lipocalin-like domain-containing protein [Thermoanaerobaculia bacterium]